MIRFALKIAGGVLCIIFAVIGIAAQAGPAAIERAAEEQRYAIQAAAGDAASYMGHLGYSTGNDKEMEGFGVDAKAAIARFRQSYAMNTRAALPEEITARTSVQLAGFIGDRAVTAAYPDGGIAASYPYTYLKEFRVYNFTLGDTVYITDSATGDETQTSLDSFEEHFFDATLTNEEFRRMTIADAIGTKYLPLFFDDGKPIYAVDKDGTLAALAEVPGLASASSFFIVADCVNPETSEIQRLFVR